MTTTEINTALRKLRAERKRLCKAVCMLDIREGALLARLEVAKAHTTKPRRKK